ncbi:hypothetical protein RMCBS344292_11685 [Rhizopus microsporus]|nr:hypothetical protein RMCBS344292_11685 [Rhizopus microsporus]
MSVSDAAKQLGIHIRTAQRWIRQYSLCPDSIFDNCKQIGLTEHLLKRLSDLRVSRSIVYNFMKSGCNLSLKKADFLSVGRNSSAKIEERYNWVCKWENTDTNLLTNCMFLDESAFDINMKRSRAWSRV